MSETSAPGPESGFDGNNTVLLATPIEAYGEKLDRLTFRRPNGKDVRACGSPLKIVIGSEPEIDSAVILRLAERLAGVPASAIDEIDAADILSVEMAVLSFFIPKEAAPTSSTAITTSPGAGVEILNPSSRSTSKNSSSSSDRRSA
jgi:Phage tail assembly chaperone proteins, E, or 41 or 14